MGMDYCTYFLLDQSQIFGEDDTRVGPPPAVNLPA
jgi:hypothetical protein